MAASGIIDAICNVRVDECGDIDQLIEDLTRQLAIAKAVRSAMDDGQAECTTKRKIPPPKKRQPSKPLSDTPRGVSPKVADLGRCILKHGAQTKQELADHLGWKLQQVAMVLARSKANFQWRDGDKWICTDRLARQLES